jgi:hypothetical protein
MNKQKGSLKIALILLAIVLLGIVGYLIFNRTPSKIAPQTSNTTKSTYKVYKDDLIEFEYPENYLASASSLGPEYKTIVVSGGSFAITISNKSIGFAGYDKYTPKTPIRVSEEGYPIVSYIREGNSYIMMGGKEGVPFYVISNISAADTENLEMREIFSSIVRSLKKV